MSAAEERLGNDPTSELWGEHRARYRFAARWATGQRVLDVACGAGFGVQMLYAAGARVLGADLDARTLGEVRQRQPYARIVRSDAAWLPVPDHSMDLVTSFETIEHVPDAAALVREVRRVLRPGGRLVLSTPNRTFGPPERHTGNPFHVQEFTADELRGLLGAAFADVQLFGQRPSAAYRFVPYLMIAPDHSLPELIWKVSNRLPFTLKNGAATVLSGRAFYPGEEDYEFTLERTDGAHALLAVAQ